MRISPRMPVVHVVTGQAEDLVGAEVTLDHRRRCAAKVTWGSPSIAVVVVVVTVDVTADVVVVVVDDVVAVTVGLEAADVVLLRRRSDLFVFGFVNVTTSSNLEKVLTMMLVLKTRKNFIEFLLRHWIANLIRNLIANLIRT